jgi:UDP-N-acetylglucosamine diphosphorylase/glucosamine-1-phosphate N-acetyltransferase
MNYILFDSTSRIDLLPFTHTRSIADIRCGIYTMRDRWERLLAETTGTLTEDYLQPIYNENPTGDSVYINAAIFGTKAITTAIQTLLPGQALCKAGMVLAARAANYSKGYQYFDEFTSTLEAVVFKGHVSALCNVWDIFSLNERAIKEDYLLITEGKNSADVPEGVTVAGKNQLFIEEGAQIYPGCVINASTGPVFIAATAEVMEGAMLRGPIALGAHSVVKMGAKLYGATTIGPGCKVGGEINNVVFFANSNKAHDGYLGNAVIGEWCNLGADTNCSNLKNNYDVVKVWHEASKAEVSTGLIFCGLIMGDHSKCGINSMFNTGTVVGVACNIYGGGFPDKYIPSFSWGGSDGFIYHRLDKAIETANRMMGRRNKSLSEFEVNVLQYVYENYKK